MPIFYEIKKVRDEFSVTFHIQNAEQRTEFHDKVAIKISESDPFIGRVFNMFREVEYQNSCGVLKLRQDT